MNPAAAEFRYQNPSTVHVHQQYEDTTQQEHDKVHVQQQLSSSNPYDYNYAVEDYEAKDQHRQYKPPSDELSASQEQEQEQLAMYYEASKFYTNLNNHDNAMRTGVPPISALSFDLTDTVLYSASHCGAPIKKYGKISQLSSSMLQVHSDLTNFEPMLYASVAAHAAENQNVIENINQLTYKNSVHRGIVGVTSHASHIPSHAYRAWQHVGILSLLPMDYLCACPDSVGGTRSTRPFILSMSPYGVRAHSRGGLMMVENKMSGLSCAAYHPHPSNANPSLITVGGVCTRGNQIHCLDIYSGLRSITSVGVGTGLTALATNVPNNALVAGCLDGTLRILDGNLRVARRGFEIKNAAHTGGVVSVAVSDCGNIICTTGFHSRSSGSQAGFPSYAFPDQSVLSFDIRMLGAGGLPIPFTAFGGGPRHIAFVPNEPKPTLIVASGQASGAIQIMHPFEENASKPDRSNFIQPSLQEDEAITAMAVSHSSDMLAIGTNHSCILKFDRNKRSHPVMKINSLSIDGTGDLNALAPSFSPTSGKNSQVQAPSENKTDSLRTENLCKPSLYPLSPSLSIDPMAISSEAMSVDYGTSNVFNRFILRIPPTVTPLGLPFNDDGTRLQQANTFSHLSGSVLFTSARRTLRENLQDSSSFPTHSLNDDGHEKQNRKSRTLNHNVYLYTKKADLCYDIHADPRSKSQNDRNARHISKKEVTVATAEGAHHSTPSRYRLKLRPPGSFNFKYEAYNSSQWPGFDTSGISNAYVTPVILLLYFTPEIRWVLLQEQFNEKRLGGNSKDAGLTLELSFLFHQMDSVVASSSTHTDPIKGMKVSEALVPSNFVTSFTLSPDATALALLDGSTGAVEYSCRLEAFYRFLVHHLDLDTSLDLLLSSKKQPKKSKRKEATRNTSSTFRLLDSMQGISFTIENEFITGSGDPTVSMTRSLTLEISYTQPLFQLKSKEALISFRHLLGISLRREVRLRAWCAKTKNYETVLQRKTASSLPHLLSLSCACAKADSDESLNLWRQTNEAGGHWLPGFLEIELKDDGNIVVSEEIDSIDGHETTWKSWCSSASSSSTIKVKARYQLVSVVSFIRSTSQMSSDVLENDEVKKHGGHYVLHSRVPHQYEQRARSHQVDEVQKCLNIDQSSYMTLASDVPQKVFSERCRDIESMSKPSDKWHLFNGFVVNETNVEDARAFHVSFKEPCLVQYRAIPCDVLSDDVPVYIKKDPSLSVVVGESEQELDFLSPLNIANSSLSLRQILQIRPPAVFPSKGDLVAIDTEFVSVQPEKSTITASGAKKTLTEGRSALARVSVIDCRSGEIIVDDYVLPQEPVIDYLTRFSGIKPEDLSKNRGNLITTRMAYMKLRVLVDMGCIFVGHGLEKDFRVMNMHVPPRQIVDTVNIFHQPNRRMISLRFLANYLLGRDMQQETHCSVEDARMAYEIYLKAIELRKEGQGAFDKLLNDIYDFGRKSDWKIGMA